MSAAHYYHPYTPYDEKGGDNSGSGNNSDNDNNSDSGNDSINSNNSSEDSAARRLNDPRYAIIRAAGPAIKTINEQLLYQQGTLNLHEAIYENQPQNTLANSLLYKNPQTRIQTTLFSFKSSNRDKNVYTTTSDFAIKLPRPFKNVTQIQLVQISYQSFFNFIPGVSGFIDAILPYLAEHGVDISSCLCCLPTANTQNSIAITEVGRADPCVPSKPLINVITVRPGRYTNVILSSEMDSQMNDTPPFNIISYTEHRNKFRSARTLYHLFNEPGRYFYSRTTQNYITTPSKKNIYNQYYSDSYIHIADQPTEQESFIAYYYPVLKEAMMNDRGHPFLDLNGDSYDTAYQRIVQHFEGLSSPYYYTLCTINLAYLIKYRDVHTFKYNLIYKYDWAYDSGMKRFNITHHELHPSITTDISLRRTEHFQTARDRFGVGSTAEYNTLVGDAEQTKAVLTDLEVRLNNALTKIGIAYSLYTPTYLDISASLIKSADPSTINSQYLNENDTVLHDIATGILTPPSLPPSYTTPIPPYNFGWISMHDLAMQSTDIGAHPSNYSIIYRAAINAMNANSLYTGNVGGGYLPGFSGQAVIIPNFNVLYSIFQYYYSTYSVQKEKITNIVNYQTGLINTYVYNKYFDVLPSGLFSNSAYIGEVGPGKVIFNSNNILLRGSTPFSDASCCTPDNQCCKLIDQLLLTWYSCLPANYVVTTLPWRLGLALNLDTIISTISTITATTSTTPYNVYIQLNVERSMNNMAVATDENYTITNEPVSESKVVLGKLLTEGSGLSDTIQSIIQSPAQFFTPLGKLDRLHFTMLLDDLTPLAKLFPYDFAFTDWDGTVQIDEEIHTLDRDKDLSTVPTIQWDDNKRPF